MTPHDPAATWTWTGNRDLPDWLDRHHHWHADRPVIHTTDGPRHLYDGWMAILWTDGAITAASATVADRVYGDNGIAGRLARAETALARVRTECAALDRDLQDAEDDGMRAALTRIRHALDAPPADDTQTAPGFRPFTPAHIPKTGNPADALVVEPYRADDGSRKWVFRCWGTSTCDGWLSLDHTSQQWAEQARDRHVAEEHPAPDGTDTTQPGSHTEEQTDA